MRLVGLLPLVVVVATAIMPDNNDDDGFLARLVPTPLQIDDAQALLDCIVLIPDRHYFISVSRPWIVVAPLESRAMDCAGLDVALCRCVHASAAKLMIQMASGEPSNQGQSAFDIEADDLARAGAMSLLTQSLPAEFHSRQLSVRAPLPPPGSFCTVFPSDYEDCRSHDLRHAHYSQCYNNLAWYRSIMAGNTSPEKILHFQLWPHHQCRGDPHAVAVPPRTLSPCLQDRPIYSYRASLFDYDPKRDDMPSDKVETAEQARSREAARRRQEWKEARAKSFGGRASAPAYSGWAPHLERAVTLLRDWMRESLESVLPENVVTS